MLTAAGADHRRHPDQCSRCATRGSAPGPRPSSAPARSTTSARSGAGGESLLLTVRPDQPPQPRVVERHPRPVRRRRRADPDRQLDATADPGGPVEGQLHRALRPRQPLSRRVHLDACRAPSRSRRCSTSAVTRFDEMFTRALAEGKLAARPDARARQCRARPRSARADRRRAPRRGSARGGQRSRPERDRRRARPTRPRRPTCRRRSALTPCRSTTPDAALGRHRARLGARRGRRARRQRPAASRSAALR